MATDTDSSFYIKKPVIFYYQDTDMCQQVHYLPVKFHIEYKVCLLTFNALYSYDSKYMTHMFTTMDTPHGHGPKYMTQMFTTMGTPHGHGPEYMTQTMHGMK